MAPPGLPRLRDRQRGNTLLLALIVMSALATLGSLTVVSVQSNLKASTNDRAQAIATYAAESGAAVAMDFLRKNFNPGSGWSSYVTPFNGGIAMAPVPGNDVPPEDPSSLFTKDQNASFDIQMRNNRSDPGYAGPFGSNDQDGQIIIRSTGHGPQGSLVVIEWEVRRLPACPSTPPLPLRCGLPLQGLPFDSAPVFNVDQPLILLGWHIVSM